MIRSAHVPGFLDFEDRERIHRVMGMLFVADEHGRDGQKIKPEVRNHHIKWLMRPDWQWLHDRMFQAGAAINRIYWGWHLSQAESEDVQFSRYEAGERYDWHRDVGRDNPGRQVSMVVLLKNAEAGGGLELEQDGKIELAEGDAVVFPSDERHRALEVERGRRETLVLWLSGLRG